jgi:hypothetical protein
VIRIRLPHGVIERCSACVRARRTECVIPGSASKPSTASGLRSASGWGCTAGWCIAQERRVRVGAANRVDRDLVRGAFGGLSRIDG